MGTDYSDQEVDEEYRDKVLTFENIGDEALAQEEAGVNPPDSVWDLRMNLSWNYNFEPNKLELINRTGGLVELTLISIELPPAQPKRARFGSIQYWKRKAATKKNWNSRAVDRFYGLYSNAR